MTRELIERLNEYYQRRCESYRNLEVITLEMRTLEEELPSSAVQFADKLEKRQEIINKVSIIEQEITPLWAALQQETKHELTPDNLYIWIFCQEAESIKNVNTKSQEYIQSIINMDSHYQSVLKKAQKMIKEELLSLQAGRQARASYSAVSPITEGVFVDLKAY